MDTARLPTADENNLWYRYNDEDAVLVFVHGVLSNSRDCWLHNDEQTKRPICYWPELIASDARFKDVGIYLGGYHTAVDSGDFPIQQCAQEVYSYLTIPDPLNRPPVMEKKKITFVCHSMGGIVARYLLCEQRDVFKDKQVGIVLIASPSYGSQLARSLDRVVYLYNHAQGTQLQWGNETLKDLDKRFRNVKESGQIPNLSGVELFENRFVIHWKWLPWFTRDKVVTEESAARYFGYAKQVGGSDHTSISKPKGIGDPVHTYLLQFLQEKDLLPSQMPLAAASLPAVSFTEDDLNGAARGVADECFHDNSWPDPIPLATAVKAIRDEHGNRRDRDPEAAGSSQPPTGDAFADALPSMSQERARELIRELVRKKFLCELPDNSLEIVNRERALKMVASFRVSRRGHQHTFWESLIANGRGKLEEADSEEERGRVVDFLNAMRREGETRADELMIPRSLLDTIRQVERQKPFKESKEYFANFVRRWGIPEGIGRLEETAARQGSCVCITRRDGLVIRLESVNGSGALVPRLVSVSYLGSKNAPRERSECRWGFSYDESGNINLEEASDAAGRLLYRCAYSRAPPSAVATSGQSQTTAHYYIDPSDVVNPRTRSGAAFVKITRDANGFDQRWEYFDGLGRAQPDEEWRFGQQFENGPIGLPIRVTSLGPDLSPTPCSSGYARAEYMYDVRGNVASVSHFNDVGQRVFHCDGYHAARFSWDARGNWTAVRLTGLLSDPVLHADGFAGWDATYDAMGNQTGQTFLDQANNPVMIKAGYARWTGTHDSRGRLVEMTYLDTLGQPTPSQDGIVRCRYEFNDSGDLDEVSYFDPAGHPAADFEGIARWTQDFDQRGRVTAASWFGLDGQPVRNSGGYSGYRAFYDAKGNEIKFVYLGLDGKPDWCNDGFAERQTRYDERGNPTEERFFCPNGERIDDNDGVHCKLHAYDEHGKRVSTRFLRALREEPAVVSGYSMLTQSYDLASGNLIRKEYRDALGRLTFNCNGLAIEELSYDSCGRQIKALYFDPNEQLVTCAEGHAGWTASYDSRGLRTQGRFLDMEGKPSSTGKLACWTTSHDTRGNVLRSNNVSVAGDPVLGARGYAAITYSYDDTGNRTNEAYLGLRDEPVALENGVSSVEWTYDNRRNKVEEAYFGLDKNPVIIKEGFSSWKASYDTRGDRLQQEFFGTDGKNVANQDGFVRTLAEYDDRGRPRRERKITVGKDEYTTLTEYDPRNGRKEVYRSPARQIATEYNRAGRLIRVSYLQLDGSPEMTREDDLAFAFLEYSYDSCGRRTQTRYTDATNDPVRIVITDYDGVGKETVRVIRNRQDDHWQVTKTSLHPAGKTIDVALVSNDGQSLVSDLDGRARWIERYDARDNRLQADYFDAA